MEEIRKIEGKFQEDFNRKLARRTKVEKEIKNVVDGFLPIFDKIYQHKSPTGLKSTYENIDLEGQYTNVLKFNEYPELGKKEPIVYLIAVCGFIEREDVYVIVCRQSEFNEKLIDEEFFYAAWIDNIDYLTFDYEGMFNKAYKKVLDLYLEDK